MRYTGVHQFVQIGAHAMSGIGTVLLHDVPPFVMVNGNPAEARGFDNSKGCSAAAFRRRAARGGEADAPAALPRGPTLDQARVAIDALAASLPAAHEEIGLMTRFLAAASRGIVR